METTHNYLQWTMDDIVFDNRNKAYGAYQLRHLTKDHLRTGLFITVFLSLLFVGLSYVEWTFGSKPVIEPEIEVIANPSVVEIAIPEIHPPVVTQPAASSTVQHMEMRVVEQTAPAPAEEPVRVEDIGDRAISSSTTEGVGMSMETGTAAAASGETAASEPYSSFGVEVMPVFPGGDAALIKFLADHAVYPAMEREIGVEGKVVLRFVVMEDGSVANIKVLKGVSAGLDKESVRVVSLLPNFIPGKQHGRAVKVYYNIPMKWKLN